MVAALVLAVLGAAAWRQQAPLPVARTEVAAALTGNEIAVAGGYLADGTTTARVDLYDPVRDTWRRGPSLPVPVNHAAAATLRGEAVVVGGYSGRASPTRIAERLDRDRWRRLPALPSPRAPAAAVVLNGRLYVVGRGRVYAIGGGPHPGLTVTAANESLS
jgi:N-acetylneuraminic acid mutarotase